MGLVKTRRRLAEDMHRRGEASEGTLPKATRRARKRVRSPHRAGAEVLPMWECCQCGSVACFQLGIEIGHWQRGNVFTRWVRLGGRVNGHESHGLCLLLVVVAQIAHLWPICGRHELGLDA